jgi:hypothetical protein
MHCVVLVCHRNPPCLWLSRNVVSAFYVKSVPKKKKSSGWNFKVTLIVLVMSTSFSMSTNRFQPLMIRRQAWMALAATTWQLRRKRRWKKCISSASSLQRCAHAFVSVRLRCKFKQCWQGNC